jgi:hypothetical protein
VASRWTSTRMSGRLAPVRFAQLPRETPTAIRGLLLRYLERNPKNRLRDIGEDGFCLIFFGPCCCHIPLCSLGRPWRICVIILLITYYCHQARDYAIRKRSAGVSEPRSSGACPIARAQLPVPRGESAY